MTSEELVAKQEEIMRQIQSRTKTPARGRGPEEVKREEAKEEDKGLLPVNLCSIP